MMRTLIHRVLVGLLFCFCLTSMAAQAKEPPDVLLKRVTQELITALRQHDQELRQNPQKINHIIENILVPYVDWHAMSQWVVGRHAWLAASEEQRHQFASEFKDLLVRTYSSTLRAYNNQTIDYLPVRGGTEGKTRVQIASLIKEPGREPIHVTYRMADKGDSWRVYDISIEGVSLLKGFQSQFAPEIQQNGLDPLIKRLHEHNEKPLR